MNENVKFQPKQENGLTLFRIDYWDNSCLRHPLGTQFKWGETIADALEQSLETMGAVCFPRGEGHDYDYVNVTPDGYVHWEDEA